VTRADEARARMEEANVIYGGSLSYRFMCRYNSGFIFRHPLLLDYDYYWRIEPHVEFHCVLNFDPFLIMQQERRKYSFVITLVEVLETIPTLWNATLSFANEANVSGGHLSAYTGADGSYTGCHYWSNFEVLTAIGIWTAANALDS
jgi:alpha 1,2-mannosyltransferase